MNNLSWKKVAISDICISAATNIQLNKIKGQSGDYSVYGASGYIQNIDYYQQDSEYLGIVKDGSGVGRVNIYPAYSSLLSTMQYILPKECCNIRFLMYVLRSLSLSSFSRGAAIPHIYYKDYCKINVFLPSIEEQEQIVSELDKIQAALDNKKEQLKKLDEFIQSKYYEMFGDPVVNDKGWNKETIKKIGRVVTGNTPSRNVESYYNKKYIEWIKTDNIIKGRMYPSEAKEYLSEEGMMKARVVDEDSILVTCIAGSISSIGGCCLTNRKVAFNQQINAIVPNKDINSKFVYYYIMLSKELIRNKASQGMKHIISKSSFEELPIILPPLPLQQAFAAYVEKVEQAKAIVNQEIAHLQELLDSRMDFYFRK